MSAALVITAWAAPADQTHPIHRIVAVGDLHGDFVAWRAIANAAGLVDAKGRWSGGRLAPTYSGGRSLPVNTSPSTLFA